MYYRIKEGLSAEDIFLIKNYAEKGTKWCAQQLNRSVSSITHRANDLSIKILENRWKMQEDEYIIKYGNVRFKALIEKAISK